MHILYIHIIYIIYILYVLYIYNRRISCDGPGYKLAFVTHTRTADIGYYIYTYNYVYVKETYSVSQRKSAYTYISDIYL